MGGETIVVCCSRSHRHNMLNSDMMNRQLARCAQHQAWSTIYLKYKYSSPKQLQLEPRYDSLRLEVISSLLMYEHRLSFSQKHPTGSVILVKKH